MSDSVLTRRGDNVLFMVVRHANIPSGTASNIRAEEVDKQPYLAPGKMISSMKMF